MLDRLRILYENDVIDEDIYLICVALHENEMREYDLIHFDAYIVTMTHISMAMHRVKHGESVSGMDSMMLQELRSHSCYDVARDLVSEVVSKFDFDVPESELHYLWLHFLNIYNEKGGCDEENSSRRTD